MTIAGSSLIENSVSPATLSGFATASISPPANGTVILSLGAYDGTGTQDFTVASVTGLGLTWVNQGVTGAGSADKGDVEVWTALAGSSPGSGAITVAFTGSGFGNASAVWAVDYAAGTDLVTPVIISNRQKANNSSTFPAVTFNAPASPGNLFYFMSLVLLGAGQTVVQTPNESPTPWTVLGNTASSSAINNNVGVMTSISPDATNVAAGNSLDAFHSWGAIGIELNAGSVVPVTIVPVPVQYGDDSRSSWKKRLIWR